MNIREILSDEEFKQVTAKNNLLAAKSVVFDWAVIIATFVICGMFPNPITIVLAILILGARQLGLGIIVHETGHRTFFKDAKLNDFVGNWLAGYWVYSHKESYMNEHLEHHRKAGTDEDPDLKNYQAYPIDRDSLRRKLTRDITGQIGWKRIKSIYRGLTKLSKLAPEMRSYLIRSSACNLALLVMLTLAGAPWLFLLWVIAFMTSHMLVTRVRQMAEHAGVPDLFDTDPRMNTRTLYTSWIEGFFIAPHEINYHLEHHMLASVPIYRLKTMHQILLKKGYYKDVDFTTGYWALLKQVTYA